MTVTAKTTRVQYTGNGLVATYAYGWKILDEADLVVVRTVSAVDTTLVLNTDYTVTGAGTDNGGNVVLSSNLASGALLTIYMEMDIDQPTDLTNQQSPFLERIEAALDRQALISQQLAEELDRSIRLDPTSTDSAAGLQQLLESVDANAATAVAARDAALDAQTATEATRDSIVADAEAAAAAAASPYAAAASDSADDAAASAAIAASTLYMLRHSETVSGSPKTTFTLPWPYDHINKAITVYIDGVYQAPASFTCPSSTSVTMDASVAVGETIYFESGLKTAPDLSGYMLGSNNLSDLSDAATARTNLGLGTAAVADTGTSAGNVPVLDAGGKLDAGVIPAGSAYSVNGQTAGVVDFGDQVGGYDTSGAAERKFLAEEVAALAPSWGGHRTGRYYSPVGLLGGTGTFVLNAETVYYLPIFVSKKTTFTAISCSVQASVAASTIRMGVYRWENGYPTSRVFDGGTVSSATTGEKTVTGPTLEPGVYALAIVSTHGPTVYRGEVVKTLQFMTHGDSSAPGVAPSTSGCPYQLGSTGGVLPATASPTGWISGTDNPPHIALKA